LVLKKVCLIPHAWSLVSGVKPLDIYRLHSCSDGSHSHISESRLKQYEARRQARTIRQATADTDRIIAIRIPDYRRTVASLRLHGRSSKLGEYVTLALVSKQLWARVMVADIRHCAVEEDREAA